MTNQLLQEFESKFLKKKISSFRVGDDVRVHLRIIEGQKERTQVFIGTVIAKQGKGLSETFTVYRNAYGSSMEKIFLLHSPKISKIEVIRTGKVRQAKLYFLRGKSGKSAKVKEQIGMKTSKATKPTIEKEVAEKIEEAEVKTEAPVETKEKTEPKEPKKEPKKAEKPKVEQPKVEAKPKTPTETKKKTEPKEKKPPKSEKEDS